MPQRDIKEFLIGSIAIVIFGAAIIRWPSFGMFLDRYFFSYLKALWHLLPLT
jgi:hypothetical protein